MTAIELIQKYGTARSQYKRGSMLEFIYSIAQGESPPPPLHVVAAAVGAAGYRSPTSDTPSTQQVARHYNRAIENKEKAHDKT